MEKNPDYIDGYFFLAKIYLRYLNDPRSAEKVTRELIKNPKLSMVARKKAANLLNKALMRK